MYLSVYRIQCEHLFCNFNLASIGLNLLEPSEVHILEAIRAVNFRLITLRHCPIYVARTGEIQLQADDDMPDRRQDDAPTLHLFEQVRNSS